MTECKVVIFPLLDQILIHGDQVAAVEVVFQKVLVVVAIEVKEPGMNTAAG